jgi:polysaccharide export outer membrane protein
MGRLIAGDLVHKTSKGCMTWGRIASSMLLALALALGGCHGYGELPPAQQVTSDATQSPTYVIGPGDGLNIFVWRNQDLTTTVTVRPDGRISVPLIEDLQAAGKTPTELARDMERRLGRFVRDPVVTVILTGFVGPYSQQVRVVGEATRPQALPYRDSMSIMDVMIQVGGLTQFAAGNRTVIIRKVEGRDQYYRVRLDDLLKDGDISANVNVLPGDIVVIPQSWF